MSSEVSPAASWLGIWEFRSKFSREVSSSDWSLGCMGDRICAGRGVVSTWWLSTSSLLSSNTTLVWPFTFFFFFVRDLEVSMTTSTSVLASTASPGSWAREGALREVGSRLEREEVKLLEGSTSPFKDWSSSFRANLIVQRLLAMDGSREARSSSLKINGLGSLSVHLSYTWRRPTPRRTLSVWFGLPGKVKNISPDFAHWELLLEMIGPVPYQKRARRAS